MDYYTGRTCLVTGAASGIGRALATELASRGADVVLWDCDADALADAARRCRLSGARVRAHVVDVSDDTSVAVARARVEEDLDHVDALFCVAGVIHSGGVLASSLADLRRVVDVNLWGVVQVVRAFLPLVAASGRGHIVVVSSAFGLMAAPGYSAYSASKFAVRGFAESLRQELALDGRGVRVSCVYPGGVRTAIVRRGTFAVGEDAERIAARFETSIARTTPEQAAHVILEGTRRGRARIFVGLDARLVAVVLRLIGGGYQDVLVRVLRRRPRPPARRTPGLRGTPGTSRTNT